MGTKSTPASVKTTQIGIPFDTNVDYISPRTLLTQPMDSLATMGSTNTVQYLVTPTAKPVRMFTAEDDLIAERFVQEIRAV